MHYQLSDCEVLNQFYKQHKDKARAKPTDLMYVALDENNKPCAVLRILPYKNFLFLRSVLTSPSQRNKGIASALILHAAKHQFEQQSAAIYTLPTPTALVLYKRLGFIEVNKADIPTELLASYRRFRPAINGPTVMVLKE